MAQLKDFAMSDIDWGMSPEQAVTMYLEWGNNGWNRDHPPVRTASDVSLYFVVDSWQDPPIIRLVRRSMEKAEDLFSMPMPEELMAAYRAEHGNWRGISEPVPAVKDWLKKQLEQH
ncbi:MAG: hypothetical protein IKN64_03490 [Desulfovibrio sp.]|nr:hypothetical protein [Desulfovibrio sp.]